MNDSEFTIHTENVLRNGYTVIPGMLTSEDSVIMGIMHKKFNVHGVQFHPESIKTQNGMKLLKNFLKY